MATSVSLAAAKEIDVNVITHTRCGFANALTEFDYQSFMQTLLFALRTTVINHLLFGTALPRLSRGCPARAG
jgi:hypothetical protein